MALNIAHYLQEHLLGEVSSSPDVRRYFAHDASVLQMAPSVVVYPRDEDDVRKTARFTWQLAQRGRTVPITARGAGSSTTGAAIGGGILLVFTAHMNKLLALNPKKQTAIIEPGMVYDRLQQTLYTHGLFFPPYPASAAFATIGGGLANNAVGEKSIKYGGHNKHVESLRVVLANGEVIETGPLSRREVNRKMGLSSLEGEIYRALDTLLEENAAVIEEARTKIRSRHSSVGYNIFDVMKKGSLDLTPLFLGSQGTLGLITEATLKLKAHQPSTRMAVISLENLDSLNDILPKILSLKPSVCDMINKTAVELVSKINPSQLKNVLDPRHAEIHLIIEFDDLKETAQKHALKSLKKLVEKAGGYYMIGESEEDRRQIWKIRHSIATILGHQVGPAKAIPVAEDISVPADQLAAFLRQAEEIHMTLGLPPAIWGQAGSGIVRIQPLLDIAQVGDRQRMFKLADRLYAAAIERQGSISAGSGDGRMRAPYIQAMYGPEIYNLMMRVKKMFDPFDTLNTGVKTATAQDIKGMMRSGYSSGHHEHLPRT